MDKKEEKHSMEKPKPLEVVSDGDLSEIKKDPVWKTWLKKEEEKEAPEKDEPNEFEEAVDEVKEQGETVAGGTVLNNALSLIGLSYKSWLKQKDALDPKAGPRPTDPEYKGKRPMGYKHTGGRTESGKLKPSKIETHMGLMPFFPMTKKPVDISDSVAGGQSHGEQSTRARDQHHGRKERDQSMLHSSDQGYNESQGTALKNPKKFRSGHQPMDTWSSGIDTKYHHDPLSDPTKRGGKNRHGKEPEDKMTRTIPEKVIPEKEVSILPKGGKSPKIKKAWEVWLEKKENDDEYDSVMDDVTRHRKGSTYDKDTKTWTNPIGRTSREHCGSTSISLEGRGHGRRVEGRYHGAWDKKGGLPHSWVENKEGHIIDASRDQFHGDSEKGIKTIKQDHPDYGNYKKRTCPNCGTDTPPKHFTSLHTQCQGKGCHHLGDDAPAAFEKHYGRKFKDRKELNAFRREAETQGGALHGLKRSWLEKKDAEKVTPETHYTSCPNCGSDDTKYGGKYELQRANDWVTQEWWHCPDCDNTHVPLSKKPSEDALRRYEESKKRRHDKSYVTKPIPDSKGGKGSFQHCINTNQDKNNPGGWCKQIERKVEGKNKGERKITDPLNEKNCPYCDGNYKSDVSSSGMFGGVKDLPGSTSDVWHHGTQKKQPHEDKYQKVHEQMKRIHDQNPEHFHVAATSEEGIGIDDPIPDKTKEALKAVGKCTVCGEHKHRAEMENPLAQRFGICDQCFMHRQRDWEDRDPDAERENVKHKADYFVEEIRANIIYHNKIFPLVGMIAGAAGKVGAKGAKMGGEILDDIGDMTKEEGQ